ncbi:MAG: hypothetical protein E7463_15495 [Ruminococcaceae bacterium]|nr:hypothetical protein [Oscillospiraceae bacterium]
MTAFEKARKYIYQHARPLDLARWQYHFENGMKEAVLAALEMYQNADGGFGYGLEGDYFNPNSSPIQTWVATEILREINFTEASHPIISGILGYLSSGRDFDAAHRQWLNTVPTNNDYPHAIWWTYKEGEVEFRYNPTACLAGFFIKYGDRENAFYNTAAEIAREAVQFWISDMPYAEQHITSCFIRLYEYCTEAGVEIADTNLYRQKLVEQVRYELMRTADQWDAGYVCMPSNFISTKDSIFCADNAELIKKECAHIVSCQLDDGSFEIPWKWWNDYGEFEVARMWWKADFCIRNMRFLREFGA